MNSSGLVSAFSRLSVYVQSKTIVTCPPMFFEATPVLCAEPLKKKKKADPAIVRLREERKKKKVERQIKKLQKFEKQLKPVMELEVPFKLTDNLEQRKRPEPKLSPEELEKRALLVKEWSRYKLRQHLTDTMLMDSVIISQQRALNELKAESNELYLAALQMDINLMPYTATGPVHTPPVKDYDSPDGEYLDVTKKYEGED